MTWSHQYLCEILNESRNLSNSKIILENVERMELVKQLPAPPPFLLGP